MQSKQFLDMFDATTETTIVTEAVWHHEGLESNSDMKQTFNKFASLRKTLIGYLDHHFYDPKLIARLEHVNDLTRTILNKYVDRFISNNYTAKTGEAKSVEDASSVYKANKDKLKGILPEDIAEITFRNLSEAIDDDKIKLEEFKIYVSHTALNIQQIYNLLNRNFLCKRFEEDKAEVGIENDSEAYDVIWNAITSDKNYEDGLVGLNDYLEYADNKTLKEPQGEETIDESAWSDEVYENIVNKREDDSLMMSAKFKDHVMNSMTPAEFEDYVVNSSFKFAKMLEAAHYHLSIEDLHGLRDFVDEEIGKEVGFSDILTAISNADDLDENSSIEDIESSVEFINALEDM